VAAVPDANSLRLDAVKAISADDAEKIVNVGDNPAAQYFDAKTREPSGAKLLSIVHVRRRRSYSRGNTTLWQARLRARAC
jgi:hypothetical protein